MDIYRERAHLLAYMASLTASALVFGADPDEPDWPVLFVETSAGQMSWHIAPKDVDLFDHVTRYDASSSNPGPVWDGHSTDDKYVRLRRHVASIVAAVS